VFKSKVLKTVFGPKEEGMTVTKWLALQFIYLNRYYYFDEIDQKEKGGSCSTHGGDEKCIQKCSC
jgi:hypothetical protein